MSAKRFALVLCVLSFIGVFTAKVSYADEDRDKTQTCPDGYRADGSAPTTTYSKNPKETVECVILLLDCISPTGEHNPATSPLFWLGKGEVKGKVECKGNWCRVQYSVESGGEGCKPDHPHKEG